MNSFRLLSRNGIETTRGSAEIAVGGYVVVINASPLCPTVHVYRGGAPRAVRSWASVEPATIRAALELAEGLDGFARSATPFRYGYGPACVEDATGACVNPLHDHPTGEAR